jgi:hypothetical protein
MVLTYSIFISLSEIFLLAKPNYSFEKRQRELAKKKQQDDKQAKKKAARENINPNTPRPVSSPDGARDP